MQDVSRGTGFGGGNQAWSRELFHVEHCAANWEPACSTWNGLGGRLPSNSRRIVPRGTRQNQLVLNCGVLELVCDAN